MIRLMFTTKYGDHRECDGGWDLPKGTTLKTAHAAAKAYSGGCAVTVERRCDACGRQFFDGDEVEFCPEHREPAASDDWRPWPPPNDIEDGPIWLAMRRWIDVPPTVTLAESVGGVVYPSSTGGGQPVMWMDGRLPRPAHPPEVKPNQD